MNFKKSLMLAVLVAALGLLGSSAGVLSSQLLHSMEFVAIDVTKSADASAFAKGMKKLGWSNAGEGHELFESYKVDSRAIWDVEDNKKADKNCKISGKKVNIAQVDIEEAGWYKVNGRKERNQADILYLAAHGYAKTGIIEYEEVVGPGSLIADPTKFNFKAWKDDLDWAIFALCSVLQVDPEGKGDPEKYSPGLTWAKALKENPDIVHGLLGYRRIEKDGKYRSAPTGGKDVEIAKDFVELLSKRYPFTDSWIAANEQKNNCDTWAIIVWDCYRGETLQKLIEAQGEKSKKECKKILYFDTYNRRGLDITNLVGGLRLTVSPEKASTGTDAKITLENIGIEEITIKKVTARRPGGAIDTLFEGKVTLSAHAAATIDHIYTNTSEVGTYTVKVIFDSAELTETFERTEKDSDNDGIPDNRDNCPYDYNPSQSDNDGDRKGNACDSDDDNDGIPDGEDDCQYYPGPRCTSGCPDGDDDCVRDSQDNCPYDYNPGQEDSDGDSLGNICDDCPYDYGPSWNSGCPVQNDTDGGDPPIYKNIQAFPTPERFMGQDLNGDGDTDDTVLRYKNIETGEVVNTGAFVSGATHSVDVYENIIAFARTGSSVRYYDINTGTFGDTGARGAHPSIYENIITFSSSRTIHYYDVHTQTLVDTKVAGLTPAIYGDTIAFESNGTIRCYDLLTGAVVDTGIVGSKPALYENLIAFETPESMAKQDLNGDGDTYDRIICYYDISTGALVNTGAIGLYPAIYGNTIAFTTSEFAVDQDLDGDGETRTQVIRYYDIASGRVMNTGKAGTEPDVYENTISFYTWERWVAQDLNGDGDTSDPIVQYCRTAPIQEAIAATTDE